MMSMIGLATSPGTEVDPACSRRTTAGPNTWRTRTASLSNRIGQLWSDSTKVIVPC